MSCGFLTWWTLLFVTVSAARRGASLPNFSLRPPLLDRLNYKTTYACEGRELRVSCDGGGVIRMIRANYGRFSISICNDHGTLDWSTNCMSYRSFLIMQDRCSQKPSCSIVVSSSIFGDPCPGTLKYLEVQYHCVSGHSAFPTRRPPPISPLMPALFNNASDSLPASNSKPENATGATTLTVSVTPPLPSTTSRTTTTSTSTLSPSSSTGTVTSYSTMITIVPNPPPEEQEEGGDIVETSTALLTAESFCPPVMSRGLSWNWTRAGEVSVQKCPTGSSGLARWECGDRPIQWTPYSPDLRDCKSIWVENLREMHMRDPVIDVARELSRMTLTKSLFSKDLYHVTDLIEQTLARTVNGMESFLDMWRRYQVLKELLQFVVETVSNLLARNQEDAWSDLTVLERKEIASALLDGLEESALLLAETSSQEGSYRLAKDNVLLLVQVLDTRRLTTVQFPGYSDINSGETTTWVRMEDSLLLPAEALAEYSKHGVTKVVFVAYRGMEKLLAPETGMESQYGFHAPGIGEAPNISQIVNSRIISASIGRRAVTSLSQPVLVELKHIVEENVTNPKCIYWDFNLRRWSQDGCWVESYNRSHTVCACDHLTNFALLMDVEPTFSPKTQSLLRLISVIGCIIAIICFLLTFIVLQILRNLTGDHISIQKNLALCLLVAELLFAAGIDQTHLTIICGIMAGLLHYFFLAAFIWLFLQAFHVYVRLVEVFEGEKNRSRWYYGLAYGVPALIVCISAVIDPHSYGTSDYCWLQSDNYFIFSFVGPAVGILFGAVVFIFIAICILCHQSGMNTSVKGKEENKMNALRISIRWVLVLLVLFSLTWTTGLLYVNDETPSMGYAFAILNSLHGIYFLVFCCVATEKVFEGCQQLLSTLMSCVNKPQNTEPPVTTIGQHSPQPQSWSSPTEKSFKSLTFTTPVPQSTAVLTSQQADLPIWNAKVVYSTSRNADVHRMDLESPPCRSPVGTLWQVQHQPRANTGDFVIKKAPRSRGSAASEGPEHIYESIDEDSLSPTNDIVTGQMPPVENYYGDQSDMSQHSSSSYGYDQRPLLVTVPQNNGYNITEECYVTDSPELQRLHHYATQQPRRKLSAGSLYRTHSPPLSYPQYYDDVLPGDIMLPKEVMLDVAHWGPGTLPDLLSCPNDNAVVMAILDGERVVSRLQPESVETRHAAHYKLSTYC